jgi:hypothetical protein
MLKRAAVKRLGLRLEALRGAPRKSRELERLAEAFGRFRRKGGSEPTWKSGWFPYLRPLTIPHHSAGVKRRTAESILDFLEANDLAEMEKLIETGGTQNDIAISSSEPEGQGPGLPQRTVREDSDA